VDAGRIGELARVFLRLGATSFGGPAAHIAMMEDEIVRRREWLSREEFLDLLGATNLIPGPNSTEMASTSAIGARLAGPRPGPASSFRPPDHAAGVGVRPVRPAPGRGGLLWGRR
jgi:chromate transport protein ChrA